MPFHDKSQIRKGVFMCSDRPAPGWLPQQQFDKLLQEFPEMKVEAKLEQLAQERRDLAARLDDLGARIAKVRSS
jgi:hypothetical protein